MTLEGKRARVPAGVEIRPARPGDLAALWDLVRGLAAYEKLEHRFTGTPERLREHLFGPRPVVGCLVAEERGTLAGCAIHYPLYSTFRTAPMLWLEDLFVLPDRRGRGIGRALLLALAAEAARLGCWRLSWAVLDWNEPAMRFYESLGAVRDEGGWEVLHFEAETLLALASREAAKG